MRRHEPGQSVPSAESVTAQLNSGAGDKLNVEGRQRKKTERTKKRGKETGIKRLSY
jgi:hypothetical protein